MTARLLCYCAKYSKQEVTALSFGKRIKDTKDSPARPQVFRDTIFIRKATVCLHSFISICVDHVTVWMIIFVKKHIWILNHYAGRMYFDQGGRHYTFSKYLKQTGYEPVIFCANSKHNSFGCWFDNNSVWHEHMATEIEIPFVFINARAYTGNGKQRILNMLDFYRNVTKAAKAYAKETRKPDIIYASSVHPLTLIAGINLAKYFGVECICEMRDLWPEGITTAYPDKFSKQNPFIKLLYIGEKWIYKKADRLIFTFEGYYDYIVERGWEKVVPLKKTFYINNGVDLDVFHQISKQQNAVLDPDLENSDYFKVIYTGSIRKANGLSELVECARILQAHWKIKFFVFGEGEELESAKNLAQKYALSNISFKGIVSKQEIPYVLSKSSLNLLNYNPESVAVYRFGSSQNKFFEYLASGKPILSNVKIAYSVIDKYCCGFTLNSSNPLDYANAILQISEMPTSSYQILCCNALKAAKEYDFKSLTQKLIAVIENEFH